MKIEEIRINSLPSPGRLSKVIGKAIGMILRPFAMMFILLIFIVAMIDFIRIKLFGQPEAIRSAAHKEPLYKDDGLLIFREPIHYGVDELAEKFQFSIVDYSDEMDVYKLSSVPPIPGIHDTYVTGLLVDFEDEIILQRIVDEQGEISSELIGFNKASKEIVAYQKMGLFNLFAFDGIANEIIGANKSETVSVKLK